MEFFVLIGIIVLLFCLSIVFFNGKGSFLIAGYNTKSKEGKEKYDVKALCRYMGKLLLVIIFFMLFILWGVYLEKKWLIITASIAMSIVLVFAVIYLNTGNRFEK